MHLLTPHNHAAQALRRLSTMTCSKMVWQEAGSMDSTPLPKVAVPVWVRVARRGVAVLGSSLHQEAAEDSPVVGFVTGCHPPGCAPQRVEVAAVCNAEVLMHVLHPGGGERAVLWMRGAARAGVVHPVHVRVPHQL